MALSDLTGQVRMTKNTPFAHGGHADLWLGTWSKSIQVVGGRLFNEQCQVAVKVIRKVWGKPTKLERRKEVKSF